MIGILVFWFLLSIPVGIIVGNLIYVGTKDN